MDKEKERQSVDGWEEGLPDDPFAEQPLALPQPRQRPTLDRRNTGPAIQSKPSSIGRGPSPRLQLVSSVRYLFFFFSSSFLIFFFPTHFGLFRVPEALG
jgi:hypothetical protein